MTPIAPPAMSAMIAFEPLGAEIRIVLPDSVGAVVHGRVRLFLSDNADAYLVTLGEASGPGIGGKPEPVTIYHAIGLGGPVLAELAGIILANSKPAALYVQLADGSAGRFTRPGRNPRSTA